MIVGLTMKRAIAVDPVESRITNMSDGGYITVKVKGRDRCGHRGELRQLPRHLKYRRIRALKGCPHYDLSISIRRPIRECFTQYLDRHLGCHFSSLRTADPVRNGVNATLSHLKKRIFILR